MLGAFAQFENTTIRKPQAEGFDIVKSAYAQRKRTLNPEKVKQVFNDGF